MGYVVLGLVYAAVCAIWAFTAWVAPKIECRWPDGDQ